MCGIFGYVGPREATPIVLEGLTRLEYRGYDSAGLAVIGPDERLVVLKAAGKLQNLASLIGSQSPAGTQGLGHTRWATHGEPNDVNAHPHTDADNQVTVVHNGIVENYRELKTRLVDAGYEFTSETDSEVIPNLIKSLMAKGNPFPEAVRLAALELRGAHGIAAMSVSEPGTLVVLRIGNAGGVTVGYGEGESFIASDLPALIPLTTSVSSLAPGQMAVVRPDTCVFMTLDGEPIEPRRQTISSNSVAVAKDGYRHFMMKEIVEQPVAVMSCLRGRLSFDPESVTLDQVPFTDAEVRAFQRVVLVGMGTSLNAAKHGAQVIERLARLPATAENAAEFRYRDPVVGPETLVVSIGQSGETVDTLEAMHQAQVGGARLLAICNVDGSQATRMAEATILMHAGPEVGVASSKTFINALVCLHLLAVHLGTVRGSLDPTAVAEQVGALARLPALLGEALEMNATPAEQLASRYFRFRRFLFIGRGALEPIALEGALKLKEISYIHAEGMAAAEMKHGPIALIDPETPVVALALADALRDKMTGSISQVRARGGPVLAVATQGDAEVSEQANDVLWVPPCPPVLTPAVATVPLQLFAYHMAVYCGCDVDQPRNLAKTVTVE